jgi:hypothetical protein
MCYTILEKAKIILHAPDWKNIVNQEKILFSRHSLWLCFVGHRSRSTKVETVGFRDRFKLPVTFLLCALQVQFDARLCRAEFIRALLGGPAPSTIKKTGAQLIPSCAPAFLIFYLPKTVGYVNFSDPINPTTPGKE